MTDFERWQAAEARVATLLLELEGAVAAHREYDDPQVQRGADLVCSSIEGIVAREGRPTARRSWSP